MKLLDKRNRRKASYPASGAKRWLACPASVALSRWVARQSANIYAKEGIAAHTLAERALQSGISPDRYIGNILHCEQFYGPNFTWKVDSEMAFAVAIYFQFVRTLQNRTKHTKVYLETKYPLSHISPKLRGTADTTIIQDKTLIVIDYKHGKGVPVSVEENEQLAFYALGALQKYGHKRFKRLEIYIVQPRIWNQETIQSWIVDDVKRFYRHWTRVFTEGFKRASKLSKVPEEERYCLNSECRWCDGLLICPACYNETLMFAGRSVRDMEKMSPTTLANVLNKVPAIEAYIKAVREYAKDVLLEGERIPKYKLVAGGRSTRKWTDEQAVIDYLTEECLFDGEDIFTDPKLKTPAQIEKLKGVDKDELADYIAKSKNFNFQAVPITDSRPAVKSATDDFEDDFDDEDDLF